MALDFSRRVFLWRRRQEGAVAVEFALVALPFFMLVIGLLEVSLMYASAIVLEGATVSSSRAIRTGQVQQSSNPEQTFKDLLCANISALIACANVRYEVIHPPGDTFNNAEGLPPQYNPDGSLKPQGFNAGGISDVVVIRTSYRYKFITPFMAPLLSAASDFGVTLLSTVTLRSEPYDFED